MTRTPAPINELTAEEEEVVSWPKIDEDSSDSSIDSGSDSEWAQYSRPETEPEWDVDSFDGQEFKINPRIRKMYRTQQLYDEYYNNRLQAFKSKVHCLFLYMFNFFLLFSKKMDMDFVLVLYIFSQGTTLELVKVVRATGSGVAKWKLYIRFMAREYHEGTLVEYQAKVIKFMGDFEPPFPVSADQVLNQKSRFILKFIIIIMLVTT